NDRLARGSETHVLMVQLLVDLSTVRTQPVDEPCAVVRATRMPKNIGPKLRNGPLKCRKDLTQVRVDVAGPVGRVWIETNDSIKQRGTKLSGGRSPSVLAVDI